MKMARMHTLRNKRPGLDFIQIGRDVRIQFFPLIPNMESSIYTPALAEIIPITFVERPPIPIAA